jgi:hypothetical protein
MLDAERANEIERLSESSGEMRIAARSSRWFGGETVLEIPEVHNLLTDDADWNADTWDMELRGLEELATTLEWLFDQLGGEMTFQSTWSGDPIEHHVRVSRAELLDVVRRSKIETRTRYFVAA